MEEDIVYEIVQSLRDLLDWAENWLPDDAKNQGARDVMKRGRVALRIFEQQEN